MDVSSATSSRQVATIMSAAAPIAFSSLDAIVGAGVPGALVASFQRQEAVVPLGFGRPATRDAERPVTTGTAVINPGADGPVATPSRIRSQDRMSPPARPMNAAES